MDSTIFNNSVSPRFQSFTYFIKEHISTPVPFMWYFNMHTVFCRKCYSCRHSYNLGHISSQFLRFSFSLCLQPNVLFLCLFFGAIPKCLLCYHDKNSFRCSTFHKWANCQWARLLHRNSHLRQRHHKSFKSIFVHSSQYQMWWMHIH